MIVVVVVHCVVMVVIAAPPPAAPDDIMVDDEKSDGMVDTDDMSVAPAMLVMEVTVPPGTVVVEPL